VGDTAPVGDRWNLTAVEITPSGDPSGFGPDKLRTTDQTQPSASYSSPPVSTTVSGELVLAMVSADGPRTGHQVVSSVSGGGLTFTRATRANTASGDAEIWEAHATAPLANAVITAHLQVSGYTGSITVLTFTGADPAAGASAATGAVTGAPAATLTTTKAGSLIVAVGHDWTHAAVASPGTGQVLDNLFIDEVVHDSTWVQHTGPVAVQGSHVSIGDTTPTTDAWDLAAVEVTPA
jgi:hypothetical protein